ncbi:MAG TPA: putative baseplate assembly protein, partial [Candidatus Binatia bacterium]|nr:putative baseplate assembly protein [Candidatus Binatia bacterium]
MSIPLPNLDDRRWADLVEEGRALIPLYAPAWTDHNAHDPGITLIELLAWIAEMDIFQVNRVSDAHRRKFLALVGIVPEPPQPARTVVAFTLRNGSKGLALPATTELSGVDPAGRPTRFRTLEPLTVIPAAIEAVLCEDESGLHDVTAAWRRGGAIAAFGTVPTPGAALYVGLDGAVAPDDTLQVVVRVAGPRADADERRRLIEEAAAAARGCIPPAFDPRCAPRPVVDPPDRPPPHHGAITVWEVLAATPAGPAWRALEVDDDTRALTLDGRVRVRIPAAMARARIGRIETTLHYLRCRFSGGAVDTPPLVAGLFLNAVEAEQSVPLAQRWTIAKRAVVPGPAPRRGARILPRLRLDEEGQIAELRVDGGEERGGFTVLDHRPGWAAKDGTLALEAVFVGTGTGMPHQRMTLAEAPVEAASFGLFTLEADGWRTWDARADFAASRRADAHFVLDPSAGTIAFGDGEAGRVPPTGAVVFATGRTTRAEAGNLAVGRVDRLADSIRNAMLFDDLAYVALQIATVSNPVPAEGGRAAETIAHAIGRAIAAREAPARAVTAR